MYVKALSVHGTKAAAARALGIPRSQFRRRFDAEMRGRLYKPNRLTHKQAVMAARIEALPADVIRDDVPAVDLLRERLVGVLRKRRGSSSIETLADTLDVAPAKVRAAVDALKRDGHNFAVVDGGIELSSEIPKRAPLMIDVRKLGGKVIRFGVTGDNHLCFPPMTTIETEAGPKRISQIRVGDMVLTHKNRYRRVKAVITKAHNGEFVRINFRGKSDGGSDAYASLMATENHPVLAVRGGREGFLPIGEIQPGDAVRQLSRSCKYCETPIPNGVSVCHEHDPFVRQVRDGARKQRHEQHLRTGGNRHFTQDILPVMGEWEGAGYRVIPLERCRPDFIAIKDGLVTAVEVEAPKAGYRPRPMTEKYEWTDHAKYYDGVEWVLVDRRSKKSNKKCDWIAANAHGFVGFVVSSVERIKTRATKVYNLIVEEDETYVAKRCVVHNCSKYERMDVLNALYDTWAAQGITTVYQLGNMIDGEARFNRTDLLVHGMEGQARYFARQWPKRKGMRTLFVTGDDHEGWYVQREGVDIGRYLEDAAKKDGRDDLVYLGHMEHDIAFEGKRQQSVMRLIHAGGGSSYATSYSAQKIVESYQGGEKPNVLLIGHYHKAEYGYPREVHCLQVGCTMDQSPFMRKKKLQAHVGGWTVEMTINDLGMITRFRCEWMPFYDLGFYKQAWAYRELHKSAA